MTSSLHNADVIVDKIIASEPALSTLPVVRALHEHITFEYSVQREALEAFDEGAGPAVFSVIQSRMWQKIDEVGPLHDSGLRLSNCLVRPDEPIDGHLADYLIEWARQQSLSEEQIIRAFVASNGS